MSAMIRFDRIGKLLLEAFSKVGPEISWGKAGMILCTGEKQRIFEDNIAVIMLSGAFNRDFKELFLKVASEKKKVAPSSKENQYVRT